MRRVIWGLVALVVGCSGAEPGIGSDLQLRIARGQLVRSPLVVSDADPNGPNVTFIDWRRTAVHPGEAGVPISGRASPDAYSVRLGLEGDDGYWVLPTGVEDPAVAGELTWTAGLDFADPLRRSVLTLVAQAVDGAGVAGPMRSVTIDTLPTVPDGDLVVLLEWDTQADVDLLVTDPNGITLSPKNINTFDPPSPGEPPGAPDAYLQGGILDLDSTTNCVIDGRRQEAAVWAQTPPEGRYEVRVDLASPCDVMGATSYRVSVLQQGSLQRRAEGTLYPIDSRETASGRGVGLHVTDLTLTGGSIQ